tara:strand:+ start:317 stop:883 length:567 start_codon:yes stop_codon:yes gene_type:complete
MENALADTSYNLELERIKNKIARLYSELLVKSFKQANPGATEEQIASFLEENELEFKGDGFDEEAEDLENLIDLLMHENEDLDEVKNKEYQKHDVQKGAKPKEISEGRPAPRTSALKVPTGGLFTPSDKRSKPKSKENTPRIPRGQITRVVNDNPKVNTIHLQEIWDKEREKLLALVRERNREYGVVL